MSEEKKICPDCGGESHRRRSRCKPCQRKHKLEYSKANAKRWYQNNRERKLAYGKIYGKQYRDQHKELNALYYQVMKKTEEQ